MLLPTQDKEAIEKIAKKSYEDKDNRIFDTFERLAKEYPDSAEIYRREAKQTLKILEDLGYHKGLPPWIEEALNSGDGVYRP